MVEVRTHGKASGRFVGKVHELGEGYAVCDLGTVEEMAVDGKGLVHGGFVFGLADYASMLAVNRETVALAKSESMFVKPVRAGEELRAEANVTEVEGKKYTVEADVWRKEGGEKVFTGEFLCIVPEKHVLDN